MTDTFKSALVPLDGSQLAEDILPFAREFARRYCMEVTLFHVCDPGGNDDRMMCQAYVDHRADSYKGADGNLPVNSLAVTGKPAEEIIGHAKEKAYDFILMATHGRSGVGRWLLGSVAEKVMRASDIPVLVVRTGEHLDAAHAETLGNRLLVPLDGSQHAEACLPYVETIARQCGLANPRIVLMRVYEKPFVTADYPQPDWEEHVARVTGQFRKVVEDYLADVKKRLPSDLDVETVAIEGNPATEIVNYAKAHALGMIVMTTHGNSPLAQWEFGSVADKVVRTAGSPVFLVPPEAAKAALAR